MGILNNVEPKEVFGIFEEICAVPRTSGKEQKISEYLVDFAKSHNLKYDVDKAFNVIIYKPATEGCKNQDTIILQAHTDMVCVHDDGVTALPEEVGVTPVIDGDYIRTNGTTLGADDGIGVAFILAVLASDTIEHPAIEAVFTTAEEIGLLGAKALDVSKLSGKRLINIDTEEEGNIVIGCAGGCTSVMSFRPKQHKEKGVVLEVKICGLAGGHSGVEIHKGSANANVLMGQLLYELKESCNYSLVSINGGTKDNAICIECTAVITVNKKELDSVMKCITSIESQFKGEYAVTDPHLKIAVNNRGKDRVKIIDEKDALRILTLINVSPAGVQKRRQHDPEYIETSLNMGIVNIDSNKVEVCHCLRGNIDAEKHRLQYILKLLAKSVDANLEINGEYPAWESFGVSDFAKKASEVYKKFSKNEPKVYTEHAGLECAFFCSEIDGIEAISIGSDMSGVHTSEEKLSISSTQRVWKFFVELLRG